MNNPASYTPTNPCIIAEFDPATGNLALVCSPTDGAISALLLLYLNREIPKKVFQPPKKIVGPQGLIMPPGKPS